MTDDKNDPYNGKLDNDADLGPKDGDDLIDDVAAAIPTDNSAAKGDGPAPAA